MRNRISNKKKIKKLEKRTGLSILDVLTRGGTNHRIDIKTKDGRTYSLYNDGELYEEIEFGGYNFIKLC